MLDFFKRLFPNNNRPPSAPAQAAQSHPAAPTAISLEGLDSFPFAAHIKTHYGFPIVDWPVVERWVYETVTEEQRATAWGACEKAWLLHFREALGPGFRLDEGSTACVLSSLAQKASRATLTYMERTPRRIGAILDGVADIQYAAGWGKDLLIVLDDEKQYYEYVSYYYPDSGEFAFSGGMYINWGCGHFVTAKSDLHSIERTIAHEMTHQCIAHLAIPKWLDEGIAVNTEFRLAGSGSKLYTPEQMRTKHRRFWGAAEIQQFWSGESFRRADDGNMLSYDLARILVDQFAREWDPFKAFVLAADHGDAGDGAARQHLGVSLGAAVAALMEKTASAEWEPDPKKWDARSQKDLHQQN